MITQACYVKTIILCLCYDQELDKETRFESFHLPITGCRFSPKNIGWIAEKSWSRSPEEETKDWEGADAGAAAGHAGEDAAEEAAADQDDRLPEFEILDLVERFTLVLPE